MRLRNLKGGLIKMKIQECKNCKFWDKDAERGPCEKGEYISECRRFPPYMELLHPHFYYDGRQYKKLLHLITASNNWCGEWFDYQQGGH
jgi:hypothetical protein